MRKTSEGRIYFVDHTQRKTTWDDPRGPKRVDTESKSYQRRN